MNTNIMLGKNKETGSVMMQMSEFIPVKESLLSVTVLIEGMCGATRAKGS